jgi:hypothetical protein
VLHPREILEDIGECPEMRTIHFIEHVSTSV